VLKVGVKMPAVVLKPGDYLADMTALEAAGADCVWLTEESASASTGGQVDGRLETWIVLGAMAAVTHRIRLGVMLGSAAARPPAHLVPGLEALGRLSPGRVVVSIPAGSEVQTYLDPLMARRPDLSAPAILIGCSEYFKAERYALLADGVILIGGDEKRVADVGTRMREFRAAGAHNKDFELWAELPMPADRVAWTDAIAAHEAAGATGIIVSWDPRLVDLLRNAGEPDDRTDLLIATG
jgi:alkanesulfonate monooxygenase SsuD/methylene tetrahydromethanopterin reductase-like flavin-dependent oxidoreductase (luciferase family)